MWADHLDIPSGRMSDSVRRIIDAAASTAHRDGHTELTSGHLFLACMQLEWNVVAGVLRDGDVNPNEIVLAIEDAVSDLPSVQGAELRVPQATRLVVKLALQRASRAGRELMDPADLLAALLEEHRGLPAAILRQHGIDPSEMLARLTGRTFEQDRRDEILQKRLELPPTLKQFATNLNLLARQDRLPPVHGRDREIQQVLEVLSHRDRASSVMLVGEAGVGKTAIVEALARRLELEPESVPVRLRHCQIVSLPMNAMVAGTMLRGMFEERLQHVIQELKERPNLILFVDEAHTLVGAGAALGAPADAANILKSVLARGEIKMIAATTLGEYKEHIQEDDALARRFRCVNVAEPTIDETRRILQEIRPRLEQNYSVRISDEAIETALVMSPRYMRNLHLPDKVIGWIDTAAVRTEMDRRRDVRRDDIVSVIADSAQIPADMVVRDVTRRFTDIEARLARRIVGQRKAITAVAERLVLNKGPLKDGFTRPDGVLLFLGPTGVGKTELAKAVAEVLFGDDKKMVRIDMSEYQDRMTSVDKLIGMPRGVMGSQRGGTFTNQLKDNPSTVVLLDEVEKASPDVLNLFLQAFDEGWVTDGRGRRVYLSDAIVIMTSNVGSEHFRKLRTPLGFVPREVNVDQVRADIQREVERRFAPEFLNRIDDVVLFAPLTQEETREIATLYLSQIAATLRDAGRTLDVDDQTLDMIATEGYNPASGARLLKRYIDTHVKLPLTLQWHEGTRFTARVRDGEIVVQPVAAHLLTAGTGDAYVDVA